MRAQTTRGLAPASWLRTVKTPTSALVVDYRTGAISLLTDDAMRVWCSYVERCDNRLVDLQLADSQVASFAQRGWLVESTAGTPSAPAVVQLDQFVPSWGTQESVAELPLIGYAPGRWGLPALAAVLVVLLARDLGSARRGFARLYRLTRLGRALEPATDQEALFAVRAVRRAARLVPARVACLEESVAVSVLLAVMGKRVSWRHGIAVDPVRLHAWIADRAGKPVEEPANTAQYTVIN
jgi:hypothetical protein